MPRSSQVVIPHQATRWQRLGARTFCLMERVLTGTIRCELQDPHGVLSRRNESPMLFCLWHNRLALAMTVYRRMFPEGDAHRGVAPLISASRDGAFLAFVLQQYGLQPVRGSTSRRGPQALREMAGLARRGHHLAITPDGPRGPRYQIQEGIIALAQVAQIPIIPVGCEISGKITLKSWDAFQVPLPFGRCRIQLGRALIAARRLSADARAELRHELEAEMLRINKD